MKAKNRIINAALQNVFAIALSMISCLALADNQNNDKPITFNGQEMNQKGYSSAMDFIRDVTNQQDRLNNIGAQYMNEYGNEYVREGAAIASKEIKENREKILEFLGLDDNKGRLYIFVSEGMPEALLKSYIKEAIWSGAILVYRGIADDKTLNDFFQGKINPMIHDKGASAVVTIDPRLFDAMSITSVPTIAFTNFPDSGLCQESVDTEFNYGKKKLSYRRCETIPDDRYIKITGAVSLGYALQEFVDHGFDQAKSHLVALRTGVDAKDEKEQKPFSGSWKDMPVPKPIQDMYRTAIESEGYHVYSIDGSIGLGNPKDIEQFLDNEDIDILDITDKYE